MNDQPMPRHIVDDLSDLKHTVEVTAPVVLCVPDIPHYLERAGQTHLSVVDVATLSIQQLEAVGKAWTEALIAKAVRRRELLRTERNTEKTR